MLRPISLYALLTVLGSICVGGKFPAQNVPVLGFRPNRASGIYQIGENVGWTLTAPVGTAPATVYSYTVKRNNLYVLQKGVVDVSSGSGSFGIPATEPEMLYVVVTPQTPGQAPPIVLGAAVAPTQLQPVAPRPADFDTFWRAKIRALDAVPMNPVVTPKKGGMAHVDFATVKLDHLAGGHIYGQLARPTKGEKFPAMVIFQWAGPPYPMLPWWVTVPASQGWLVFNIEPHDVLPDAPQSYYDALPTELKNYGNIGQDDRDTCYFLKMYLADYRAVDYIASRPDWDGKTLLVIGSSMGGQQAVCVAGLHPKVTHMIVNEPAGCDLCALQHGRQAGYPFFPPSDPKAAATAPYFDAINFASRIRAQSLVAMGFVDTIAPPAGIWTAYNQIKAPKEAAPMVESPHNNASTTAQQLPYTTRAAQWESALAAGRPIPPKPLP